MKNSTKQNIVAADSAAMPSINEAKLRDSKTETRLPSSENDTFTAFFPVTDEKGNVIVGKLEGPRATVMAAMQEPEHPLMMTAFDELEPIVRDCIWRNHGRHQSLEQIADELRLGVEDVKRNSISGFKNMKARIDGANA